MSTIQYDIHLLKVITISVSLFGSTRMVLAILGFLGFICMSTNRNSLGLAMVCMVNHTATNPSQQLVPDTHYGFIDHYGVLQKDIKQNTQVNTVIGKKMR